MENWTTGKNKSIFRNMRILDLSFEQRIEAVQSAKLGDRKFKQLDLLHDLAQELREEAKMLPERYDLAIDDED